MFWADKLDEISISCQDPFHIFAVCWVLSAFLFAFGCSDALVVCLFALNLVLLVWGCQHVSLGVLLFTVGISDLKHFQAFVDFHLFFFFVVIFIYLSDFLLIIFRGYF